MYKITQYLSAFFLFLLFPAFYVQGQERNFEKEFESFEQEAGKKYDDFRNKVDEEFAGFLKEIWTSFELFDAELAPFRPEPPTPVIFDKTRPAAPPVEIPIIPAEPTIDEPHIPFQIAIPEILPEEEIPGIPIRFYGTKVNIATDAVSKIQLKGITEKDVADAWTKICKSDYSQLLRDCLTFRKEKELNDWSYILFTRDIGRNLYGAGKSNEIAFFQMFLLVQSGYKVRLARINEDLKLLISPEGKIYGVPFIRMDGRRYYAFDTALQKGGMSIYTYEQDFAYAQNPVNLHITKVPALTLDEFTRAYQPADKSFTIHTTVNKNLIDFYREYPQCDVEVYFNSVMSPELKSALYPTLQQAIEGESQQEAANVLIAFVQTAFDYKTDNEQFGYEKPNFYEENFFYPYNDCEDRAMLFARLVTDLLGLESILLDYPDHIAAAVCFTEDFEGDYVTFEDKKYVICDPTYIGAPVGMSMEQYRYVAPGVIR